MHDRASDRTIKRTLLLVPLGAALFASPVMFAWAQDDSPWSVPYVAWAVIVAGAASMTFSTAALS